MVSSKHDHETKARVRQEQHTKVNDKKAENSGKMRMDRHPGALRNWRFKPPRPSASSRRHGQIQGPIALDCAINSNHENSGDGSSLKPAAKKGGNGSGNWGSLGAEIEEGKSGGHYRPTEPEAKLQLD